MTTFVQPDPGPHNPLTTSPPRGTGVTRRTTSIDINFPDFDAGTTVVDVRGRDSSDDGVTTDVQLVFDVDTASGVIATATEAAFVGANLRSGFRRWLAETMPDEAARRTLRYSVLNDAPGAYLVSGYALLRDGLLPRGDAATVSMRNSQANVCAGWDVAGPVYISMVDNGVSPTPYGPVAPPLEAAHPDAWHTLAPLGRGTIRRRRLLDVWDGGAHGHFRDSYMADDHEMVMHEYEFDVVLDNETITALSVEPRTLPWHECPNAIASAQGVVGMRVADVEEKVRLDYRGTPTCTHLNSTLSSLADIGALLCQ